MGFDEVRHDILREIGVGRDQKGPEVLSILHQVRHCPVLLVPVLGHDTLFIVHSKADMLAPEQTHAHDAPMSPKQPHSTVLTKEEHALIVTIRHHTLLPLDNY